MPSRPSAPTLAGVTDDKPGRSRIGTTALGRLHLRVTKQGRPEDVILERRWAETLSARMWCERVAQDPGPGVEVQEAQVFAERWQHPKSWETEPVRAVPESVQDGRPDSAGGIAWAPARSVDPIIDGHRER